MWHSFSRNMMRNSHTFVPLMLVFHHVYGQHLSLREGILTFYETQVPWLEAQAFCRDKHTDLITVRNEKDAEVFNKYRGWIGLHRDSNTVSGMWKWSRGDEEATYFNWEDEVPQENEDCVFKPTNTTKWRGRACNKSRVFMCYDELLVLMKKNKTWEEALEHCRTLKEMGSYDLATLITHDDHDYARERAQQATTDEVWTGLRYLGDEWLWMGGEAVQYENIPSCSGAWCGVLEKNGDKSFGIRDCGQRRNFFCYKKY